MKEGLNKKVPANDVLRALQFQEANVDIAEKEPSEEGSVSSAQTNEDLREVDRDLSIVPPKKRVSCSTYRQVVCDREII
uniref:Uncharacterized protein n=1 Tax=Parascaris equorum TaxID=6256 RepID=A0A914R1I5_PAREQ